MQKTIIIVACLVLLASTVYAGSVFDKAPWERFVFFPEPFTHELVGGYSDINGEVGYAPPVICWQGVPFTSPGFVLGELYSSNPCKRWG